MFLPYLNFHFKDQLLFERAAYHRRDLYANIPLRAVIVRADNRVLRLDTHFDWRLPYANRLRDA